MTIPSLVSGLVVSTSFLLGAGDASAMTPRSGRIGVAKVDITPDYPTLADVDSAEALAAYQEKKRAYKQLLKSEGGSFDPGDIGKRSKG